MADDLDPAAVERAASEYVNHRHPMQYDRGVGIVQGSHYRAGFVAGAVWQAGQARAALAAARACTCEGPSPCSDGPDMDCPRHGDGRAAARDGGRPSLPDPAGGCVCTWHSEDRGGGYSETVVEYEPACPVHSVHLYDPRAGMWVDRPAAPTATAEQVLDAAESCGMEVEVARAILDALGIEVREP